MKPETWVSKITKSYREGRIYSFTIKLPKGNYKYRFEAEDKRGIKAVGFGTNTHGGPIVKATIPYLKGSILDKEGRGIKEVKVHLLGDKEKYFLTAEDGSYTFWLLKKGGRYILKPSKEGYIFLPRQRVYSSLSTGMDGQDFIALKIDKGEVKIIGGKNGWIMPDEGEVARIVINPSISGIINLRIYNLRGTLIWSLSEKIEVEEIEAEEEAQKEVLWRCVNNFNQKVASGIYILHIKGAGLNLKKKLAVIR
jgi:hypothetical protein